MTKILAPLALLGVLLAGAELSAEREPRALQKLAENFDSIEAHKEAAEERAANLKDNTPPYLWQYPVASGPVTLPIPLRGTYPSGPKVAPGVDTRVRETLKQREWVQCLIYLADNATPKDTYDLMMAGCNLYQPDSGWSVRVLLADQELLQVLEQADVVDAVMLYDLEAKLAGPDELNDRQAYALDIVHPSLSAAKERLKQLGVRITSSSQRVSSITIAGCSRAVLVEVAELPWVIRIAPQGGRPHGGSSIELERQGKSHKRLQDQEAL